MNKKQLRADLITYLPSYRLLLSYMPGITAAFVIIAALVTQLRNSKTMHESE